MRVPEQPVGFESLFTANHQLNYDEVVRRMGYWLDYALSGAPADVETALASVRILQRLLATRKDELYLGG